MISSFILFSSHCNRTYFSSKIIFRPDGSLRDSILEDSLIRTNGNGPLHYPENTELWLGYLQIIGAPITRISAQLTK